MKIRSTHLLIIHRRIIHRRACYYRPERAKRCNIRKYQATRCWRYGNTGDLAIKRRERSSTRGSRRFQRYLACFIGHRQRSSRFIRLPTIREAEERA